MSERGDAVEIHRILVAVDASPHSRAALEAAVEMAARFRAELLGLFVEDIDLLRAAALPFTRELGSYSARLRHMSAEQVERHFRARVRQIERLFRSLSEREAVQGSFQVVRGRVGSEIRIAAQEVDVLIVGRVGWSQIRDRQVGSTTLAACCDEIPGVTVVLQEGSRLASPITVVYDGSLASRVALVIAARLVDELSGPLQVLLLTDDEDRLPELRDQANGSLEGLDVVHQMHGLVTSGLVNLVQAIYALESRTLVLPATLSQIEGEAVGGLLEQIEIPVLLVR
ncbi:MAG: universal stress protein [Anaerolineae bacterium]|nr:universal stress protein [Anaerolineae bacterium]